MCAQNSAILGMGWHHDLPDSRDYLPTSAPIRALLDELKALPKRKRNPARVDLREFFSEVYDQQTLNSSSAHACCGLVQYFERRAHGRLIEPSRAFLDKVTRNLIGVKGDTGADLRTTLKALTQFGTPPERYWPYEPEQFDDEPVAFLYSFRDDYCAIEYVRLDSRNGKGTDTLERVKAFLLAGFPCVFGFPVPSSLSGRSDIPYRPTFDHVCGGQALVAVGYDDDRLQATKGALLVRNSWGSDWGDEGYGWLPYDYVREQLAVDFWTLLKPEWLESGEFRRPSLD